MGSPHQLVTTRKTGYTTPSEVLGLRNKRFKPFRVLNQQKIDQKRLKMILRIPLGGFRTPSKFQSLGLIHLVHMKRENDRSILMMMPLGNRVLLCIPVLGPDPGSGRCHMDNVALNLMVLGTRRRIHVSRAIEPHWMKPYQNHAKPPSLGHGGPIARLEQLLRLNVDN
ncbi:hypothetical protein VNO77_22568 [Canavalia gladiata]|uniref:Uncharacterized protein n=1 Tax=Canavalia gladiata TaxID=3824 RepID=A0AAN9QAP4_CANGL